MTNMGYEDWYRKIAVPFRKLPIAAIDGALAVAVALAYIAMAGNLAYAADERLTRFVLVPAVTFAIVGILRAILDRPRPYETFAIDPIIAKNTAGKSMPSRHMASAVAIACAFAWIDAPLAAIPAVACIAIGAARIIGGVHFPRDLLVAAAISLACAAIGYLVIP